MVHEHLRQRQLESAPISDSERILLRFVETVTRHAYRVSDDDVTALRAAGWSDEQIGECVYITALFAFFNRVADAFGLEDPGYFASAPVQADSGPHEPPLSAGSESAIPPPCPPTE